MKADWRELHLTFSKLFHLDALMQNDRILWRKMKINLADKRYFNKYSIFLQHPPSQWLPCYNFYAISGESFCAFPSLVIVTHWLIWGQIQQEKPFLGACS